MSYFLSQICLCFYPCFSGFTLAAMAAAITTLAFFGEGRGVVNCTMTRAIGECVILTLTDKSDRKAGLFLFFFKCLTKRANADFKSRFSSSRRRGRPSFVPTSSKLETDCRGKAVQLYGGSDGHQICPNVLYIDDTHTHQFLILDYFIKSVPTMFT